MGAASDLTNGGDEVRIVIQLPQPIDLVSKVLNALADTWPNARIDTSTPGGWTILIQPEDT